MVTSTTYSARTLSLMTVRHQLITTAASNASFVNVTRSSASVAASLVYSGDLQDNPLWLGMTLLGAISLFACGVVFVKRSTNKFRERWMCDLSVSVCYRLLSDCDMRRCRTTGNVIAGDKSCNGGGNWEDQLNNVAVAGQSSNNGSAVSLQDNRQRHGGSRSSMESSAGPSSRHTSRREHDHRGTSVKSAHRQRPPATFEVLRKGNFAVDMTLRTAAAVASAVAATAAEINDISPKALMTQPSSACIVSAATVATSSLSAKSYDGVDVSTCSAAISTDDVLTFAHATYNNGANLNDTVESKMQSIALREITRTDDVTIHILTSDVDRDLSVDASTPSSVSFLPSPIASTPSSIVGTTHTDARQTFRDPLNDTSTPVITVVVGGREDTTDLVSGECEDRSNHNDHVTAIGINEPVGVTQTYDIDVDPRGQRALLCRSPIISETALTSSLRLVNDGVGIDV